MHLDLTTPKGQRVLVSTAHVMSIATDGGLTRLAFLPGSHSPGEGSLLVTDRPWSMGTPPGFLETNLVTPHAPPLAALVNVAAAVRAESCQEGVLLHFASAGLVSRLLVDATLDAVAVALASD